MKRVDFLANFNEVCVPCFSMGKLSLLVLEAEQVIVGLLNGAA